MQNSESPSLTGRMFTSCPSCLKQFRIQASQLSIADGRVRCGVCGHEFNALSRLSDVPLMPDKMSSKFDYVTAKNSLVGADLNEEPEFVIPNENRPDEGESDKKASSKIANSEEIDFLSEYPYEILGDIPNELREDLPIKRNILATISWGIGVLLLLISIIAQLAWFNRDELLLRYSQLGPVARKICDRLQCQVLRYKDISAIKLLNRDVRNHPLYEDKGRLLVNATMANKSATIQPFPRIQLALFNTGGKVIGYREFKPREYLNESVDIPAGMVPESPIHFVLEVVAPAESAVSFEFHFL